MAEFKCPGAEDIRTPVPEYITCTNCGREIEIFSDEMKVKCFYCKKIVYRQIAPSCIEWCKFAKKCIGENKYNQMMKDKEELKKKQEEEVRKVGRRK